MAKKVLIVLPNKDFDVTETAVPWRKLTDSGVELDFCTEHGQTGICDPLLLDGVIFGKLGAAEQPKEYYRQMITTKEFQNPIKYSEVDFMKYDAVLLPGGHAPGKEYFVSFFTTFTCPCINRVLYLSGMKQYLENKTIQEKIVPYFKNRSKVVGAICHGTIVLARATDPETGKSILHKRQSTCLPKYMERYVLSTSLL